MNARTLPSARSAASTGAVHVAAGMVSGALTALVLHPLDTLKVFLQVQDGHTAGGAVRYRGLAHALSRVLAEDGIRGLYRGAAPGAIGSAASWGAYFAIYDAVRSQAGQPPTITDNLWAAWVAGSTSSLLTNPIWLVKTRLQLQREGGGVVPGAPPHTLYRGTAHALVTIAREEGLRGLYRGLGPALLLVSHGMIQFALLEELKALAPTPRIAEREPAAAAAAAAAYLFAAAATSKAVAALATYPYQVIKARVQQRVAAGARREYFGLRDSAVTIWRYEGLRGFYKGFLPNVLRVAPQSALTISLYEGTRAALGRAGWG